MNILHYSLGFPPYRSGGLTKFCTDLMKQQNEEGHKVSLLWPGRMNFIKNEIAIKDRGYVDCIRSFEIVNPLPISYDEGIANIDLFMDNVNESVYESLLEELAPNIIHLHTLMGLHKAFLTCAKRLDIRLIFTAHDFFPICPKVTMYRKKTICTTAKECKDCADCNTSALTIRKIKLLQSPVYRTIKNNIFIRKLREKHRGNFLYSEEDEHNVLRCQDISSKNYNKLRQNYEKMLQMMNCIHYNSSITRKVYEDFFELKNYKVLSITHRSIFDKRRKKYFNGKLRFSYLGSASGAKGFFLLKTTLDEIWKIKQDFELNIFFKVRDRAPYIKCHEKYQYTELEKIFLNTDVLIVPSIWYETFGFTVLEALSFGVPVVISGTVGARDILADGTGIIIDNITVSKLKETLLGLTKEKLLEMNTAILTKQFLVTMPVFSSQITEQIYMQA